MVKMSIVFNESYFSNKGNYMYIPDEHYVGLQLRKESGGEVMLGFATPVAKDKAYSKRKSTVDSWSKNYQNQMAKSDPRREGKVLPNTLSAGFEIARSVRRSGWNGGNVVWRVVDPRGFELEVSSANLASILDCSTVVNGVIQERCIWGRDGANNILVPEDSEPYREFVKLTQLKDQAASKAIGVRDLKPGNMITLESGEVVEYMGKFYCVKHEYLDTMDEFERRRGAGSAWDRVVERFVYKTNIKPDGRQSGVELVSRLKVANIVDGDRVVDIKDNAKYINEKECTRRFGNYIYVSATKLTAKDIKLTVEEVDAAEAIADVRSKETYEPHPFYFCLNSAGDRLKVKESYGGLRYLPFILYETGSYKVHARDLNYRTSYMMPESSLPNLKWYKIVMHYGSDQVDQVRS